MALANRPGLLVARARREAVFVLRVIWVDARAGRRRQRRRQVEGRRRRPARFVCTHRYPKRGESTVGKNGNIQVQLLIELRGHVFRGGHTCFAAPGHTGHTCFEPRRAAGHRVGFLPLRTPNSAAAERVFSMLKLMFGDAQMSALMDMIQAALMLKYKGRKIG